MGVAGLVLALGATAAPLKEKPGWEKHQPTTTTVVMTTTAVSTTTVNVPAPPPPAPPSSDIAVLTLGAVSSVFAGQDVTYTTVVTNLGSAAATGVHLVDDTTGGARFLTLAASTGSCSGGASVSCSFGSLASGASAVLSLTVEAPANATTIASTAVAGADQLDPQAANNSSRVETVVLPGHAGAPILSAPGGSFAPPLIARAERGARVVTASVTLDEGAAISVSILDRSGRPVTLLTGSRVDYVPSGHPHMALPRLIDRGGSVPLRLRLKAPPGGQYRIVVQALAPSGESSSLAIPFST